ncbi:MAG: glycosyltransferase [Thermoleophilia bacterium]|nr:glycosyltransferase [Thermoleophilia bacterium]
MRAEETGSDASERASAAEAAPARRTASTDGEAGAQKLRILVLAPFPPRRDGRDGGSRVLAGLVTALAPRHEVALLHLGRADGPEVDDAVAGACRLVVPCRLPRREGRLRARWWRYRTLAALLVGRPRWVTLARARSCRSTLRRLVDEFRPDVVQCEFAVMAQYLPAIERARAARVFVQHDPVTAHAAEHASSSLPRRRRARVAARVEARGWRRFETHALRGVDAAVVFTEADREALRALGTGTPVHVIPFGFDVPSEALDPGGASDRATLVFVGNFVHRPNVRAAQRLVHEILPLVRRERPGVEVEIVGRAPPPAVQALAGDGVVVTGEVPSVVPHLDRANVVVVPLETGGGVRVKLLEALAAGKAVVATPRAAKGLALTDREHLYLAETNDDLAGAVLELLDDRAARVALADRARHWALQHAGWELAVDAYDDLYRSLVREPRAGNA